MPAAAPSTVPRFMARNARPACGGGSPSAGPTRRTGPGAIIPGESNTMDETRLPRVERAGIEHRRPAVSARAPTCARHRAGAAGRARFRAGLLLAAALGGGLTAMHPRAQERPGIDEVVDRAAAYVARYVDDLSNVVMEEDYRQTYYRDFDALPSHSRLVSEFLLMRVDDSQWVGFRDVVEINGRQLEARGDRLASLFVGGGPGALAQARRISEESARYNLGATDRTFNVPTYSLFFLHPANVGRFRFERLRTGRAGCAGEAAAWDLRFEEIAHPALARGHQGISLPARGRFCLDPESGRVLETEFELHHPAVGDDRPATDAAARVRFGFEPRLRLWVPTEMRDSVSEDGGRRLAGTARYRNYRRFNVVVSENADSGPDENDSPR